jgi:hypothetical protein
MFSLLMIAGTLVLWSAYASDPNNGLCENFAVHAGTSITFADTNAINNGDVGSNSISGPAYVLVDGEVAIPDDPPQFANSVHAAWVAAMVVRTGGIAPGIELGGNNFTPGTYRSDTINIADDTTVTLDGQHGLDPVFIFQAVTTLLTGVRCKIVLINGAKAENVFWALGTTFTTGTNTDFQGSILAGTAITVGGSNTMHGRLVALTSITFGAINVVDGCVVSLGTITFGTENFVTVPEPITSPCISDDVKLVRKIGAANYTANPITIISQSSSNEEVTFEISQEWMTDDLSYLFARFQDKEVAATKCHTFAQHLNAAWKSEPLTAICTRGSKIALVEVWASDNTFYNESDVAVLHPTCTNAYDLPPTVKYVFQVECVSTCVECPTS